MDDNLQKNMVSGPANRTSLSSETIRRSEICVIFRKSASFNDIFFFKTGLEINFGDVLRFLSE